MHDLTATKPVSAKSQDHCPLMKLPTELRNRIYNFALQHILDAVYNEASHHDQNWRPLIKPRGDPTSVPFYTGALALTQTSRTIRAESLDTLAMLMAAHIDCLIYNKEVVASMTVPRVANEVRGDVHLYLEAIQAEIDAYVERKNLINRLVNSAVQVRWICYTMAWTKGGGWCE